MPSQFQLWEMTLYQVWRWKGCVTSCSRTWTEWWLNIRRHTNLAPSPQHLKQEKGKSREGEKRKRGSSQLVKTEEKENALFSVRWEESPPAEDFEPDIFGILRWTVDCETLHLFVYLKDTQSMLARDLCRGKCFAQGGQEIVWDFCTWGWTYDCLIGQHLSTKWFVWDKLCFYLNLAL